MVNLTNKQKETLQVIESYIASNGMPPTLAELQILLDVSSNQAVLNHLDALEEKGFIERKKTARGIQIKKELAEMSDDPQEETNFIDLLTEIAEKKKEKKSIKKSVGYSNPHSADQQSGEMLVGYYNNEQY